MHETDVAQVLVQARCVEINLSEAIEFRGGILSPIYIDSRRITSVPFLWDYLLERYLATLSEYSGSVPVGVESGSIGIAAVLAYRLNVPWSYVYKKPKKRGTKRQVAGADVSGRKVVVIEDMMTTGKTTLDVTKVLREHGAHIQACIAIATYNFAEKEGGARARERFGADCPLHELTTIPLILDALSEHGHELSEDIAEVRKWYERMSQ